MLPPKTYNRLVHLLTQKDRGCRLCSKVGAKTFACPPVDKVEIGVRSSVDCLGAYMNGHISGLARCFCIQRCPCETMNSSASRFERMSERPSRRTIHRCFATVPASVDEESVVDHPLFFSDKGGSVDDNPLVLCLPC